MADDFSALELDTELDDDMRALFGDSQEPAGPSMQSCSTLPPHAQFGPTQARRHILLNPSSRPCQPQTETSLLCITNKRPAPELHHSWPHKSRQLVQAAAQSHDDSYDDLELEPSAPANSTVSYQANSSSARGQSEPPSMLAVPSNRFTAPVPVGNLSNVTLDSASQVTEQYRSAYSQQASQASASLLNTSARHQLPFAHASATARHGTPSTRAALPRHTNISSALVSRMLLLSERTIAFSISVLLLPVALRCAAPLGQIHSPCTCVIAGRRGYVCLGQLGLCKEPRQLAFKCHIWQTWTCNRKVHRQPHSSSSISRCTQTLCHLHGILLWRRWICFASQACDSCLALH